MELMTEPNKSLPQTRAQLIDELKRMIVDSVQIHHIPLSDIHEDTTLFQEGLGLDSVDILEVVVAVERKFGIKIKDAKSGQQIFKTIGTIADFITQAK